MNEQAKADLSLTKPASANPAQTVTTDAEAILAEAWLAHWEHHLAKAEELYKQAIALDASLVPGRVLYAIFLAQQDRADEAEAQIKHAVSVDPELTGARLNTARSRAPDDKAILHLWAFWERTQEDAVPLQASLNQTAGMGPTSTADPEIVEQDQPQTTSTRIPIETAQSEPESQSANRNAETSAEKPVSIEVAPTIAETQAAQVRVAFAEADRLRAMEKYEEAMTQLKEIQALLPDDEEIRQRLNDIKNEQRKLVTLTPWLNEAQQKALAGDIPVAFELVDRAEKLKSNSQTVSQSRQQIQQLEQALQLLAKARRLAQIDPEAALSLVDQAQQLASELDISRIKADIQAELASKQKIEVFLQKAQTAEQSGDLKEALNFYKEVDKLQPDHPLAQAALKTLTEKLARVDDLHREAEDLYQTEQYAEAEQTLQQALELDPGNEKLQALLQQYRQECLKRNQVAKIADYCRRAEEQEEQGEYEQAQTLWTEALQLWPDDETLYQAYIAFMERQHEREKARGTIACPNCGQPGRANAKFCRTCGHPLQGQICPQCGALVRSDAKFCSACGQSILPPIETGQCKICRAALRPQAHFCAACGHRVE